MPRTLPLTAPIECHLQLLVVTTEVQSEVDGVIHANAPAYQLPALRDRGGGTGQLEVVDLDNKEEVKSIVVVTTSPVWDVLKAN